jgi:urease accessory protein
VKHVTTGEGALLDLSFVRRANRTVIDRRVFTWPFVLTRSFYVDQDRPDRLSVIVQTGSGAIHGEDSLAQRLMLGPGTAVCLTNQGATSVHRADPAARAMETVMLHVASGARLEYVPEPRILFPDAALCQSVELDCASDACALVVDAFTMHDPSGEARCFRELETTFCLRRLGGEPVLIDRTRLCRPDLAIFHGHRAFGSAIVVLTSNHDLEKLLVLLTTALGDVSGLYAAASMLPGSAGLGVRLAALDLRQIRLAFEQIGAIYRRSLLAAEDICVNKRPRVTPPPLGRSIA